MRSGLHAPHHRLGVVGAEPALTCSAAPLVPASPLLPTLPQVTRLPASTCRRSRRNGRARPKLDDALDDVNFKPTVHAALLLDIIDQHITADVMGLR